ncbi:OmpA family protein [Arenibacter nanhaiticus]|uniref:OmpA family protein n=1 Tax=Arenibacter nanhaiticus TaxID=558155 RepID=A0A1M6CX74_9FLAO|nr:OmpA family protein [Arenibacter nanhaiticus]
MDKDDKCPDVAGTVANQGCPEVTPEVQKQLNEYARTILFDTGKSSIKAESTAVMVDIITILNEYPNAKFSVEGHTDSVGSASLNQRLSESRALSVKQFLVDKGVEEFRLSAVGYGENKPIASNNTSKGRAQNRRVEINLVK